MMRQISYVKSGRAGGCNWLEEVKTLDLMKCYHQVKMEERSRPKTAFTCHLGLFQYRRMPFGLTNAPVTFQRLMNRLFTGKSWESVFVYLDDILVIPSKTT